jgi:hypothetical protein
MHYTPQSFLISKKIEEPGFEAIDKQPLHNIAARTAL